MPVDDAEAMAAQSEKIVAHYDRLAESFYTSGMMMDQGIIDPRDSRKVLGFALETCLEARARILHPNTFGVARI